MSNMNLPNKLTLLRVLMIPLFLVLLYFQSWPHHWLAALVVFALASITDALDGNIARSRGLVTDFGKFMDPLADKLLVTAALMGFVDLLRVPGWVVFLIVARELTVTGLRTIAADKGVVIAADKWGKVKTVSQMVWICYGLLMGWVITAFSIPGGAAAALHLVFQAGMVLVLASTLLSGANYLWKNRDLFSQVS